MKVVCACCLGVVSMLMGAVAEEGSLPATAPLASRPHESRLDHLAWQPLAEAGDGGAVAQNDLGLMYLHGCGLKRDYSAAIHWLGLAAEQGQTEALVTLGKLYMRGEGVERNYFTAFEHLYRAASAGSAEAQSSLGLMYLEGLGVSQNHVRAMKWFRKSAAQGYAEAQQHVDALLRQGLGLKRLPYVSSTLWSKYG